MPGGSCSSVSILTEVKGTQVGSHKGEGGIIETKGKNVGSLLKKDTKCLTENCALAAEGTGQTRDFSASLT